MELFRRYLEEAIGPGNAAAALSALGQEPSTAIRLNPFKASLPQWPSSAVPWNPLGRILAENLRGAREVG